MAKSRRAVAPFEISIEKTEGGKTFRGHYWTERDQVVVTLGDDRKSTQIGSGPAETVASVMFGEMVMRAQKRAATT
jgi:hypothetical protein